MKSRQFSPILFAVGALVTFAGCAAPGEEAAASSAEVRTAQCPATIDVSLSKPSIQSSTPTLYHDGSELSATEIGRVAMGMNEARELGEIRLPLTLSGRSNGRCSYEGAPEDGRARRATLRTKDGKDILDVYFGEFRTYLFPSSYGPEGLTFDANEQVSFMVNVDASGPYSDGASLNVEIGSTTVLRDPSVVADHAYIESVANDAGEYFYPEDALGQSVRPLRFSNLPQVVHTKGEKLLADESERVQESAGGSAFVDDLAYEIVKDGRVVGYVISIGHAIDHPLFDGSGVRFYVDVNGEVIIDVSWTG